MSSEQNRPAHPSSQGSGSGSGGGRMHPESSRTCSCANWSPAVSASTVRVLWAIGIAPQHAHTSRPTTSDACVPPPPVSPESVHAPLNSEHGVKSPSLPPQLLPRPGSARSASAGPNTFVFASHKPVTYEDPDRVGNGRPSCCRVASDSI
jgi:hypothetical protein